MRIIGGAFRGRRLVTPTSDRIRPTADRVRETLFNMLSNKMSMADRTVLDLFSGTGALGLEALSRGAGRCVFVDRSREGWETTMTNLRNLGMESRAEVLRLDATRPERFETYGPFDLVFMDPPYGRKLAETCAVRLDERRMIAKGGWVIVEESTRTFPTALSGLELEDQRRVGDTTIGFFQRAQGR